MDVRVWYGLRWASMAGSRRLNLRPKRTHKFRSFARRPLDAVKKPATLTFAVVLVCSLLLFFAVLRALWQALENEDRVLGSLRSEKGLKERKELAGVSCSVWAVNFTTWCFGCSMTALSVLHFRPVLPPSLLPSLSLSPSLHFSMLASDICVTCRCACMCSANEAWYVCRCGSALLT